MKKNYFAVLFASLAVLLVGFFSNKAVPIYDGVGFPDEPYRYVSPPSSKQTTANPPTDAAGLFKSQDFANSGTYGAYISSGEAGPQVVLSLGQGSLIIPPNTKSIDIRVQPLAPADEPKDGKIAGNVYKLTITGDAGKIEVNPSNTKLVKYINLRLPQGSPAYPTMEYKAENSSWQDLNTNRVGNDIYSANVKGVGDYALVETALGSGSNTVTHHSLTKVLVGIICLLLGMVLIIAFIRRQARSQVK